MEPARDVRQRDIHDRDVEQKHEHPGAHRRQGPPPAIHSALLSEVSFVSDEPGVTMQYTIQ
jgi:hypothetical protein